MKKINISTKKHPNIFALVDNENFEWLNQWKWYAGKGGKYVCRAEWQRGKNKSKMIYMHRLILDAPNNLVVDHINKNGLDNRKKNIRLVTDLQNKHNHKLIKTNKTGYHGVYWDKQIKKYGVGISVNGKHKALGYFIKMKRAAKAYDIAAIKHRGIFAQTNFERTLYA